jgi:hypothetical protein
MCTSISEVFRDGYTKQTEAKITNLQRRRRCWIYVTDYSYSLLCSARHCSDQVCFVILCSDLLGTALIRSALLFSVLLSYAML